MQSTIFASTLAIGLGLGTPMMSAIIFPDIVIAQTVEEKKKEADRLVEQGSEHFEADQIEVALQFWQRSLLLYSSINDNLGVGASLSNLGYGNARLGNYAKAIEFYQQSLVIAHKTNNRLGEGNRLRNLGNAYESLGDYVKAIYFQEKSLVISREINDRLGEGRSLGNLGNAYYFLGDYAKAIEFQQNHLKIAREINNLIEEGRALGNLGTIYLAMKNYAKSIEYLEHRLYLARNLRDRRGEGAALVNIGNIYSLNSNHIKASNLYASSLAIFRDIKDKSGEMHVLKKIATLLIDQNQIELAIVFYKQSVAVSETIRQGNHPLPKELQSSYTQTVAATYRSLADLLLGQNRTIEALQVLDLLKAQDLQDFLKSNQGADRPTQGIEFLPQEQAILTVFNNRSSDLNTFLKSPTVQTQTQYLQANAANQNLQLKTYTDLQSRLKKLGKNAALFYPLILDDRLELVILTNDRPPIHKPVPITRKQLETEVTSFRNQLQNRSRLIKEPAQKLYQSFIQPIEAELKAAGVDTIVYAPDDIMRYVPLAALHDGKQWLAERYQINYLTALALTPLEPDQNKTPRVLAAALTEAHQVKVLDKTYTFPALQFTQPEIETLAKTLPNTTTLINQTFNRQTLTTGIPQNTILHLATHGMFVPNSPDQSIIVMGDGSTISLREIEQQWKLPNVSLVVLSACETAIGGKLGNGIEVLGFGYQMQRIGSRASISSLWTIDDGGTQGFMNTFYTELKQGKTPAFAIQQTQKDFIQGKVTPTDIQQLRAGARPDIPGGIPTDLTHPYYWAPFILVGNGL